MSRLAETILTSREVTSELLRALAETLDPAQSEMAEPIVWEQTCDGWSGTTRIKRFGADWLAVEGDEVATPGVEVTLIAIIEHGPCFADSTLDLYIERIEYDFGASAIDLHGAALFVQATLSEVDWADSERERHRSSVEAAQ